METALRPPAQKISQSQLNLILRLNEIWVFEGSLSDGQQADLSFAILTGLDFTGKNLKGVKLNLSDLRGAKFDHNLKDASSISFSKFSPDALPWLILRPRWVDEFEDVIIL